MRTVGETIRTGMPRLGPLVPMGDGYSYQKLTFEDLHSDGYTLQRGYVKIWLDGRVVDRALTVTTARRRAELHRARLDAMVPTKLHTDYEAGALR